MDMLLQSDFLERFCRAAGTLTRADAADGERQLYVLEHRLVGDQVVALKDETDGVIAVGVPVAVGIPLGTDAVDDQITLIITIQAADNIQHGRLTGAALSEDRDKFVITQAQRNALERLLHQISGFIYLSYAFYLQHSILLYRVR